MQEFKNFEIWFVTGSQHLYGPETLDQVAEDSRQVVAGLNDAADIPMQIVFKPVLTTPDAIRELCLEANSSQNCVGLITMQHFWTLTLCRG
jgi:L-arabinose isomerase